MKKLLTLLLFSQLAFSQNIELLKNANNSDKNFTLKFNQILYPNYQTIESYEEGIYLNYILVPNGTSENEISNCKIGNPCQNGVSVKYKLLNGIYSFNSAKGDSKSLFKFWNDVTNQSLNVDNRNQTYKNSTDNIWLNLSPTPKTWMITNMSDYPRDLW